ncbi:MAG: oligosaccharide biosynthesis protein Alg14 [Actinomycetota bacterium]
MTSTSAPPSRRVLAVASGGGHWVQLLRTRPAFDGHDLTFVTVREDYRSDVGDDARFRVVVDATEWQRLLLIKLFLQVCWIVVRTRPHAVVTTGAAPGLMAILAGRLIGARTMWIDSIANVEQISKSGRIARRLASHTLTQWPDLAGDGVDYAGSVL